MSMPPNTPLSDLILSFAPAKPPGPKAQRPSSNMLSPGSAFDVLQIWWDTMTDPDRTKQLGAALRSNPAIKRLLFRGDTALGLWFMQRAADDPKVASWVGQSALRTMLEHASEVLRADLVAPNGVHADLLCAYAKLVPLWVRHVNREMTTETWSKHMYDLWLTVDQKWGLLSPPQHQMVILALESSMTTAAKKIDRLRVSTMLNGALRASMKVRWLSWRLEQGAAMNTIFPKNTCVIHLQYHRFFHDVVRSSGTAPSLSAFQDWMDASTPLAKNIVNGSLIHGFASVLARPSTDAGAWLKALRSGPLPEPVQNSLYPDGAQIMQSLRDSISYSMRDNAPTDYDPSNHAPTVAHMAKTLQSWHDGLPAAAQEQAVIHVVRSIQRDVLKSVNCMRTTYGSSAADPAVATLARAAAQAPSFKAAWTTQAPRILNLRSSMDRLCREQSGTFDEGYVAQARSLLDTTVPRVQATLEMILALQNDRMEIPTARPICLHAASWPKRSRNPARQQEIRARWEAQAEAAAIYEKLTPDDDDDGAEPQPPRRRM